MLLIRENVQYLQEDIPEGMSSETVWLKCRIMNLVISSDGIVPLTPQ